MIKNPAASPDSTDPVTFGRSIIQDEIDALQKASEKLDHRFTAATNLILSAPPGARLVVSGIGKAGFVAMKLSATLSSIGFPSFFLHPADAIHGDLGRMSKSDIAILLSNSGETAEVLRLLPTLKRFGCSILSITSSASSTLANHSDVVIETGRFPEAGPLGLAPTTSAVVMLALGDALAMTLVQRRGFTREEFAVFHPGGDLGRSLMLVSQIMRTDDAHCVVRAETITKAALHAITVTRGRPGAASVVDASGTLIGVFTDGNLRRLLESNTEFLERPIGEVCSSSPKTITADKLAQEAARVMRDHAIDQIIVVDTDHKPIGLIDVQDLLAHGMIRAPEPVK
jgi:arabinose-5-phosphate isomerase